MYLWIATVQRRVDSLLLTEGAGADASTRTNTRFYISSYLVTKALGAPIYNPSQLTTLAQSPLSVDSDDVKTTLAVVLEELQNVAGDNSWQADRAAKSNLLAKAVIARAVAASATDQTVPGAVECS